MITKSDPNGYKAGGDIWRGYFMTIEPKYLTVSFVTNGGSHVPPQRVERGRPVQPPHCTKPHRAGLKWLIQEGNNWREWNFNDPVTKPMTLHAQWLITVNYEANGGVPAPGPYHLPEWWCLADPPPMRWHEPWRPNEFQGWFIKGSNAPAVFGSAGPAACTKPTDNITLYARWQHKVHATFKFNDGKTPDAVRWVNPGQAPGEPPLPGRPGLWRGFWVHDGTMNRFDPGAPQHGDAVVKAIWFTKVEHQPHGGSPIPPVDVMENSTYTAPNSERAGFRLVHWILRGVHGPLPNEGQQVPVGGQFQVKGWTRMEAVWQEQTVVTFDANEGTGAPPPVAVEKGQALLDRFPASVIPTRHGYKFLGWATTNVASAPDFTRDTPVPVSLTVYAVWEMLPYGTPGVEWRTIHIKPLRYPGTLTVKTPVSPVRELADGDRVPKGTRVHASATAGAGFEILGIIVNGVQHPNPHIEAAEVDLTIEGNIKYGLWTALTVTFDCAGGKLNDWTTKEFKVRLEDRVADPGVPVREHHTFLGWFENGNRYDFSREVSADFTLTAHWKPVQHTVKFDLNGGKLGTLVVAFEERVDHGGTVNRPAGTPTRDGHWFKGWFKDGAEYDFGKPVNENITITAEWGVGNPPGTVTFTLNGGTLGAKTGSFTETVQHNEAVARPSGNPTKKDHTFKGWFKDGVEYDFGKPVNEDITITAKWELQPGATPADEHTVTFSLNGGKLGALVVTFEEKVAHGGTVNRPAGTHGDLYAERRDAGR